jgi:hypothetical protein
MQKAAVMFRAVWLEPQACTDENGAGDIPAPYFQTF